MRFGFAVPATLSIWAAGLYMAAQDVPAASQELTNRKPRAQPAIVLSDPSVCRWWPYAAAFSPDGKTLLSVQGSGHLNYWHLAKKRLAQSIVSRVVIRNVAFNSDGTMVALGSGYGWVDLRGCFPDRFLRRIESPLSAQALAFSPDRKYLGVANDKGEVFIYRCDNGLRTTHFECGLEDIVAMSFSGDGHGILVANEATVRCFDLATGKESASLRLAAARGLESATYLPDGKSIVLSCTVYGTEQDPQKMGVSQAHAWAFRFRRILGGELQVWDARLGRRKKVIPFGGAGPATMAFSANRRFLATGCSEGVVRLWRISDWEKLALLGEQLAWVENVAFSQDGKFLVACLRDNTIRIWNIENKGKQRGKTKGTHLGKIKGTGNWAVADFGRVRPRDLRSFSMFRLVSGAHSVRPTWV